MKAPSCQLYFLLACWVLFSGCPHLLTINDSDNDGIFDGADQCPTLPGTLAGCPDADGDGIADKDDTCPSEPGDKSTNGCPASFLDKDGDGVANAADKCPDEVGSIENHGCPFQLHVSGFVYGEDSGIPVSGAEIRVEELDYSVWTDGNGVFKFDITSPNEMKTIMILVLRSGYAIYKVGYTTKEIIDMRGNLKIYLKKEKSLDHGASYTEDELFEKIKNSRKDVRKHFANIYFEHYKLGKYTEQIKKMLETEQAPTGDKPDGNPWKPHAPRPEPTLIWQDSTHTKYTNEQYDCLVEKIGQGVVAFDTLPSTMVKGRPYTLEVVINEISKLPEIVKEKEKELGMDIKVESLNLSNGDTVGHIVFEEIKVGSLMKVVLSEQKGDNEKPYFEILSRYPDSKAEKVIDCEMNARWGWTIKPLRKGENRKLLLNIYVVEKGSDIPIEKVREKRISIDVEQAWFQTNITKAVGVMALVLALVLLILHYKRREPPQIKLPEHVGKVTEQSLAISNVRKKKIFLSYAHEDEELKEKLDTHLSALRQTNMIETWNDRKLLGGEVWDEAIRQEIHEADIILFLVSADFIDSKQIFETEITLALDRHNAGGAVVVPIYLRPCDFKGLPFDKLKGFPKDSKSVTTFDDEDIAFTEIAKGIRFIVESDMPQHKPS